MVLRGWLFENAETIDFPSEFVEELHDFLFLIGKSAPDGDFHIPRLIGVSPGS